MGPIPVMFLYFNATKNGEHQSLLNWKTSQEINSSYYDVERSSDALNYEYIGRVQAAGNSQLPIEYFFTDNQPTVGLNYYRLKQVDMDGHFIYTPTRLVRFSDVGSGSIKYYPNPTSGSLTVEFPPTVIKEPKLVNISNAAGIILNQFKLDATSGTSLKVELGFYPKGIYFIQVKTATINSVQRIVLQ